LIGVSNDGIATALDLAIVDRVVVEPNEAKRNVKRKKE